MKRLNPKQLGQRVKALRDARGWSQTELATAASTSDMNISQGAITDLERGQRQRSRGLPEIAAAFGISVEELISLKAVMAEQRETDATPLQFLQAMIADETVPLRLRKEAQAQMTLFRAAKISDNVGDALHFLVGQIAGLKDREL